MKYIKYIILFLSFFMMSSVSVYSQNSSTTSTAESKIEKQLTDEEKAHLMKQRKIDESAIQSAKSIRMKLRDMMSELRKVSPKLADVLVIKIFNIRIIQYIASLAILGVTLVLVKYFFRFIFEQIISFARKNNKGDFFIQFVCRLRVPVNVFAWVLGVYLALAFLIRDESNIAFFSRVIGIAFWSSLFWLIAIIFDVIFAGISKKTKKHKATSTANLVEFLRRVIKFFVIVIAVLSILTNCGVNVNTIVASLGIGGMALAFASQDTIANFFGSVSIILDRPFIVGDWVKTNSCEGTVEAIGFRSTRIRTFSKTLVTIPNSTLAKESVENFTKMPLRKVTQPIGLTYSATSSQIQKLLEDLRKAIPEIEGVAEDGLSVDFVGFGASSLDVNVIYYTKQIDFSYFSATRRKVNFAIMDIVAENGLSFAFPSMSLYIEADATKQNQ